MKLSRKVMQPRMFFLVSKEVAWRMICDLLQLLYICISFLIHEGVCVSLFVQFNDALMYTTPVQSGQYKLNSVLSLAGMKVRDKHIIIFNP